MLLWDSKYGTADVLTALENEGRLVASSEWYGESAMAFTLRTGDNPPDYQLNESPADQAAIPGLGH